MIRFAIIEQVVYWIIIEMKGVFTGNKSCREGCFTLTII